jgi:pyrroloquinoline quinone biosynthesis protein E
MTDHRALAGPRLARRARMRWDPTRSTHVVLAPESVLTLTRSAAEVMKLADGTRPTSAIVSTLESKFPGAPVKRDVENLFARLRRTGLLDEPTAPNPTASTSSVEVHEGEIDAHRESERARGDVVPPPIAMVAELTYRCPLRCGYCSNPVDLDRYRTELDGETWQRVIAEAADLGVLQLHFSGGEPLLRDDLDALISAARSKELYTNLITSAYALDENRLDALVSAGLDHVQISLQDTIAERADAIAGTAAHERKLRAARAVKARGTALSINVVLHRGNLERVGEIIDVAERLGAERLELANTQYHGWALRNRDALIPTRDALDAAAEVARAAQSRLRGRMTILYVFPDYYTDVPKPCMDGWGRRFVTVAPDGSVYPCPGAHELPLRFESVRDRALAWIWRESDGMNAFRGNGWMPEPCASCDRRDIDHGGCRCQAYALTRDVRATDPACAKAPAHDLVASARLAAGREPPNMLYRVRTRANDHAEPTR